MRRAPKIAWTILAGLSDVAGIVGLPKAIKDAIVNTPMLGWLFTAEGGRFLVVLVASVTLVAIWLPPKFLSRLFGPKLRIHRAFYGSRTHSGQDVTAKLRSHIFDNRLSILVNSDEFGDPAPNQFKELKVDYSYNGTIETKVVQQDHWCNLP